MKPANRIRRKLTKTDGMEPAENQPTFATLTKTDLGLCVPQINVA
jgi:hypothetical protein